MAFATAIRARVESVAAGVPVTQARTLSSQVDRSLVNERLIARLLSAFAILALVLAAVGLYGVLGYSVERRTGEIGLRLALGATRGGVLRSVLRQSAIVVAIGSLVGVAATTQLSRPLSGLLVRRDGLGSGGAGGGGRVPLHRRHGGRRACRRGAPRAWTRSSRCARSERRSVTMSPPPSQPVAKPGASRPRRRRSGRRGARGLRSAGRGEDSRGHAGPRRRAAPRRWSSGASRS